MKPFIPFALPDITDAEKSAVAAVLESGWITTGARVREFEAAFARRVGAKHAVAVNSCTAALHLALEALGVGPGDEVIVPTMTFAASAEVVRYLGARPVLVDIDPHDHCVDPAAVRAAVSPRTRVIMPVHYAGQACDMDRIGEIARDKSLPIVEDAAHAFPTSWRGKMVGSIGDASCFSFYATKTLTTGEGGMIVTDSDRIAERARLMALHGISKDAWKRYTAEGAWYYEILAPGFKYNMTDIAGALGGVQLCRAEEMLGKRRAIARVFAEAFGRDERIELLRCNDFDSHAWHLFVIKLRGAQRSQRDRLMEELKARGIGASVHFIPLHIHPYYRDTFGYRPEDLPVALDCFSRSLSLPIYSRMSEEDVGRVVNAFRESLDVVRW